VRVFCCKFLLLQQNSPERLNPRLYRTGSQPIR
jgi:hypothetical protein